MQATPEKAKQSRYEKLQAAGSDLIELPPIESGEHLISYLIEIGTGKPAGMGGLVAIDHTDIAAWQYNTGIRLNPWEAKTIRELSRAYCAEFSGASDKNAQPPYVAKAEITQEKRDNVASAFKALAARRKRK